MQKEIKRIHVLQGGLIAGSLYAAMGLVVGLIYGAIMMLVGAAMGAASSSSSAAGGFPEFALMGGVGLAVVIIYPIIFGAMGFVLGIIGSAFYNLVAKFVGGLKFDVEDISPPSSLVPPRSH